MSKLCEQIINEALALPLTERAEIVERLLLSFDSASRRDIDHLWAEESESRIDAYELGEINAISSKEVFDKIENKTTP